MMLSREVRGGLERYTFRMQTSWLIPIAERHRDSPELLRQFFLDGYYTIRPRPCIDDIISHSIKVNGVNSDVTLVIKRGHYTLLTWLRDHEAVTFRADGSITCTCHPDQVIGWLVRSALPDYAERFEESAWRIEV